MAKKFNLSKGIGGRVIGAAGAGAASAVYDRYLAPMLPTAVQGYGDYVKIGLGAIVPAFVKHPIATTIGDGLMAVAASNVVASLLPSTTNTSSVEGARLYPNMAKRTVGSSQPAKNMVGKPKTTVVC